MASPVEPGTILAGKYRVDRVLGEGGMGVVVAATDQQLERRVAIKFLLPEYAEHREAAQRFLREARAAVKIQSEHVARVIDVGTMDTGAPYMVMEYLEGRDLAALIEEPGQVPVEDAVGYVLEGCDAIAEAHSVGIVHRDLKPANLFLTKQPDGSNRIKVLDFGISKALVTTTGMDPSLTRTSSMMGSPLYMSPEQMKSAKNVDPRTDVWALGVILYELLAGEPPFYAESIPELSAKVLLEEPPSIYARRPEVSEALEAVVKRALAKDLDARYPTVADLAQALEPFGPARSRANVERASRVLKVSGIKTAIPESRAVPPQPSGAYARTAAAWADSAPADTPSGNAKGRGPLIGGAIALAVVLGGGAVFLMRGTPPAPVSAAAPQPEPPQKAAAPSVEAEPAVAASAVAAPEPPPAVAPALASAAVPPPVAPAPVAAKVPVAVPIRPRPPVKPKPDPKAAAGADPFSGFGSRK